MNLVRLVVTYLCFSYSTHVLKIQQNKVVAWGVNKNVYTTVHMNLVLQLRTGTWFGGP